MNNFAGTNNDTERQRVQEFSDLDFGTQHTLDYSP